MNTLDDQGPVSVSERSRLLPRELFGDPVRKAARVSDDNARAPLVNLYAERLMKGLDIWTGQPSEEAWAEAVRIRAALDQPKHGGRRQQTNHTVGSV